MQSVCEALEVGEPTLADIITELEKPGRDIREGFDAPVLREDVLSMEDLRPDMILTGTVRNVTDFGAFVDIGVHQDGLVHLSQLGGGREEEAHLADHEIQRVTGFSAFSKKLPIHSHGVHQCGL